MSIKSATPRPELDTEWNAAPEHQRQSRTERKLALYDAICILTGLLTPPTLDENKQGYPLWVAAGTWSAGIILCLPHFSPTVREIRPPFQNIGALPMHEVYYDASLTPYELRVGVGDKYATIRLVDRPQPVSERIADLEDLLTSARAIAERKGEGTAWERFSDRLAHHGIGSVTAKTFRVLPSDTE